MARNRILPSRHRVPVLLGLGLLGLGLFGLGTWTATSLAEPNPAPMLFLNDPSTFDGLESDAERSLAYFLEAGKVITHPRCLNCHPSGDSPLQGDAMEPHEPMVVHGRDGHGAVGQRCQTCHFEHNFDAGGVPGAEHWHLAPPEMAWVGLSLGEICRQIKDPQRNGGRDLEEIATHMAEDPLVGWGWQPGAGRQPVPGDWQTFGALIRAWVDTGAVCPPD